VQEDGPLAGRSVPHRQNRFRKGDAIIGFAPIAKGRLIAAFVNPTQEAFSGATRILIQQLTLGVVGLGLLFGALALVARSISKPIQQLGRAWRRKSPPAIWTPSLRRTEAQVEVDDLASASIK
jgi:hypothetical protein